MTVRTLHVTDAVIADYAEAARDWNPVHFDDAFARERGLDGRIAHGMISGALLAGLVAERHPEWLESGSFVVKFVAPCPPGQTVSAVLDPAAGGRAAGRVDGADGRPVLVATAEVPA